MTGPSHPEPVLRSSGGESSAVCALGCTGKGNLSGGVGELGPGRVGSKRKLPRGTARLRGPATPRKDLHLVGVKIVGGVVMSRVPARHHCPENHPETHPETPLPAGDWRSLAKLWEGRE